MFLAIMWITPNALVVSFVIVQKNAVLPGSVGDLAFGFIDLPASSFYRQRCFHCLAAQHRTCLSPAPFVQVASWEAGHRTIDKP